MGRTKNKFGTKSKLKTEDKSEEPNVQKSVEYKKAINNNINDNNHKNVSNNKTKNTSEMKSNESINYNNNKMNANNETVFSNGFKRNKFRDKCFAKRAEKGMILLSPNIEKKIYNLKKALRSKGLDGEEIRQIVRKRRRQEENKFNRDQSKGCFKCRQMGHKLADCPLTRNDCEEGVDICYRCGSSEHKLSECSQKSNDLPFVKCFLCSQIGHLTRSCHLNKRGIYPKGGSCKACGSLNHLIKDCPQNVEQDNESNDMTLTTFDPSHSADADMMDNGSNANANDNNNIKRKVIKF